MNDYEMIQNSTALLIDKFIQHELSAKEADDLLAWLKEGQGNIDFFNDQLEINHLLQKSGQHEDPSDAYAKIERFLISGKKKKYTWASPLKYAAIFIGIIGIGLYYFTPGVFMDPNPVPDVVTLELGNGKIEKINFLEQKSIINSQGQLIGIKNQQGLNYEKAAPIRELVYNTLRIPYGKIFQLVLSDGSKVILNAGSSIKYPIYFLPNHKRKIFLEGEAYFEVTKDSLRQFIVSTENQEVTVYGTTFDVSAYENGNYTKTVLLEGSVGVSHDGTSVRLVPGEMALSKEGVNSIEVHKTELSRHIAWIQGKTVFVSKKFSEIIQVLERKFDVEIHNEYEELNDQMFTATFTDESITEILDLFKKSRPFKFTINKNEITIMKAEE